MAHLHAAISRLPGRFAVLTGFCLVLGLLPATPVQAEVVFSDLEDAVVRFTGTTTNIASTTELTSYAGRGGSGASVPRCPVWVFPLPHLGAVNNPFLSASLTFHLDSESFPSGSANADLHGLGRRAASIVLDTDFHNEDDTDLTDATKLQDDILNPNTPPGLITTDAAAALALRSYLNAQYAGGTGAGQYVFLRVNTDAPFGANHYRYNLTMADGAAAANGGAGDSSIWPQLHYTVDSGPVPPPTDSIIASDGFASYTTGALAGQGTAGYGWAGGWVAGAAGSVTASSASSLIYFVPAGGGLIGGGRSVDIAGSGTGVPVTRPLSVPQTSTFYVGFLLKVWGNPNTEDIYTLGLNNSPSDTANGFNCGIRGVVSGNQTHYFIRKGTGTPPPGQLASVTGKITNTRYLVLKVEKTGVGNFNKVTGWVNPGTNAEAMLPNGDMQLLADLGVSSFSHVYVRSSGVDSGDRCTLDGLALVRTFADLMAPAGPGPDERPPVPTIQVEFAPDGSANAPVSAQTLAPGQSITNYAIARAANGSFLSNTPAVWQLSGVAGGVLGRDLVVSADGRSAVFTANGAGSARIYTVGSTTNLSPSGLITVTPLTSSNAVGRPFIWTRMSERDAILSRIRTHGWAAAQFLLVQARADAAVAAHQANRSSYLRQLPLSTSTGAPKFTQTTTTANDDLLLKLFDEGVDCAAMYHLTGEARYARCAADILHNAVLAYLNVTPFAAPYGGWIYSNGLLGEASISGMQLPVIYDYLYDYLKTGPQVFQLQTTGGAEVPYTAAAFTNAQAVFRTFYQLTRDRGQANNNWSPNMAQTLVPCVLALDNPAERTESLKDYLVRDNARQTSLKTDATRYPNPGDIWPESLDYSEAVNTIHPYLMTMVDRHDPAQNLFSLYPNIALSMARPFQLVYPHGLQIHFGDFHHDDDPQPWFEYEVVYRHARARNLPNLRELYGPLINAGIAELKYDRTAQVVDNPLPLLWFASEVGESAEGLELPRTDTLSHAGVALQRNLSSTGNPSDGLMCFVAGGAHVHSHANGMNMELYGEGEVLGAEGGRGDYGSALHENYYRLFAAHNTIIVNGASRGEGGWVGVAINTVQVEAMEPEAFQPAVSPEVSFTCTSFADTKGTLAEGTQQRTLALVRTSPTTGYYVDLYRSKSTVTNRVATTLAGSVTNQFHDYVYHNLGDTLDLQVNGVSLPLFAQPARFQNDIGDGYQQPGWRYFSNPVVSYPLGAPVRAQYHYGGIYMDVHLPAVTNREYARADAPGIILPPADGTKPAPVLAVRQMGDAWDRPFAVVFEPHRGSAVSGTVQNVTLLQRNESVVGLKVESLVGGQPVIQYVISNPTPTDTYWNPVINLFFTGRFAVVTDRGNHSGSLYVGDGRLLSYAGFTVSSVDGANTQANVEFALGETPMVTANAPVNVTVPDAPSFVDITRSPDGSTVLTAMGAVGVPYRLWASTNVALWPVIGAWNLVTNDTITGSPFTIKDMEATNQAARFYRFSTP